MDILKLKTGEMIKVFNGACMEAKNNDKLLLVSGKVGKKNVEVLQLMHRINCYKKFVIDADFIRQSVT